MYAVLPAQPDIFYAVTAFSGDTLYAYTTLKTAAKRILQYLKSVADFWLHFDDNGIAIIIDIGIRISIRIEICNTIR